MESMTQNIYSEKSVSYLHSFYTCMLQHEI